MLLYSSKKLDSYKWEELPINDNIITWVEQLADDEDAPKIIDRYPIFEQIPGVPVTDIYDNDYDSHENIENSDESDIHVVAVPREVPDIHDEDNDDNVANNNNYITEEDSIESESQYNKDNDNDTSSDITEEED